MLNAAVLGLVVAVVAAAGVLLGLVMHSTLRIDGKAERIAKSGRGINIATDSIVQVNRTNRSAGQILHNVAPLDGRLADIVGLSHDIDQLAASINTKVAGIDHTAGDIDGTAKAINTTAGGINQQAASILDVAKAVDEDARLINVNLDTTIDLAKSIKGDTGNILDQARRAHRNAACIDKELGGSAGNDGHCVGGP